MTDIQRRAKIRVHRMTDAPNLGETDFNRGFLEAPDDPKLGELRELLKDSSGAISKVLLRQSREEGGFSLVYLWFKPGFGLARHRHDDDCVYFIIAGVAIMGNQVLRAGDTLAVPAGGAYQYHAGPEGVEVLEIRKDVDWFGTRYLPTPPERIEALADSVRTHRDEWAQMTESPLMAANRGLPGDA